MSILNSDEKKRTNYDVFVTSVKKLNKGYGFTLIVNGVRIYQMRAYEYKNSQGEEKVSINFPSYKMGDDFVNYVFFPMDTETRAKIVSEIAKQLKNA